MKRVVIDTIPHDEQRYPTVGDYVEGPDEIRITVSAMGDDRYEAAVALHEMVEMLCLKFAGIDFADVDRFDIDFEARRRPGDTSEPGDDPAAPYTRQHQFASAVERLFALEVGLDWADYGRVVLEL